MTGHLSGSLKPQLGHQFHNNEGVEMVVPEGQQMQDPDL
jgi:hypothetical protein